MLPGCDWPVIRVRGFQGIVLTAGTFPGHGGGIEVDSCLYHLTDDGWIFLDEELDASTLEPRE